MCLSSHIVIILFSKKVPWTHVCADGEISNKEIHGCVGKRNWNNKGLFTLQQWLTNSESSYGANKFTGTVTDNMIFILIDPHIFGCDVLLVVCV